MKNILKFALIMFTAVSLTAAQAGELTISGGAKASYTITGSDNGATKLNQAKGLGVSNEFDLGASGELDNGYTWNYQVQIDTDTTQDDAKITMTTPYGTAGIFISEGGLEFSKKGAVSATGDRASDTGYDEGMVEEHSIGDLNNIQYHTPADLLPAGIMFKVGYAPDTTAGQSNSVNAQGGANLGAHTSVTAVTAKAQTTTGLGRNMTSYQLSASPIDGLDLGASYSEFGNVENATAQAPESGSYFIKYTMGSVTAAYGKAYIAHALEDATTDFIEDTQNNKASVSVNVNDDLSVSYIQEKSTANHKTTATTDVEVKSTSLGAAYTMGGMTLALALVEHENVGYVANVDVKSSVFNVTLAF
jgi:hypothetical protein